MGLGLGLQVFEVSCPPLQTVLDKSIPRWGGALSPAKRDAPLHPKPYDSTLNSRLP